MTDRALLLVDIDGVVADVTHRQRHLEGSTRDWMSFFAEAADDAPIEAGIAAVQQAAEDGREIVYVTGRPERLRGVTERWLRDAGLPVDRDHLVMRGDRDRRPAARFKLEVVRRLDRECGVDDMWDDDEAVVSTLQAAGFPARVPEWAQPRSSAFAEAQDRLGRT